MTISSRGYKYTGNEIPFLNGQFVLFIMLKYLVCPVKSERARSRCVECTLTQFAISVLYVPPVTLHLGWGGGGGGQRILGGDLKFLEQKKGGYENCLNISWGDAYFL